MSVSPATPLLRALDGHAVPLTGVRTEVRVNDLFTTVENYQTFENREHESIEAIYTFPAPREAVLLDLTVVLAGRTLTARAVERTSAEDTYEETLEAGDAAVMLENPEPGLYTMNVGNLPPGETASVRIRHVMPHRWLGNRLRIFIPTVIAPRYGRSALAPHQQPETDPWLQIPFDFRIIVEGQLAAAEFDCPSHRLNVLREPERSLLLLARPHESLDRDVVVNIDIEDAPRAHAVWQSDGDEFVTMAAFRPSTDAGSSETGRSVKIVLDCSGSMGGDSIAQVKRAFGQILDTLRPQDYFNVIRFGSTCASLFPEQRPATGEHLDEARRLARALDADMGGTEIGAALEAAWASRSPAGLAEDVLLLTDGEVGAWQEIVTRARSARHRIFTVGVGSAVAEAFVRELPEATHGHCELASPREGMEPVIRRQFGRMFAARLVVERLVWPDSCRLQTPQSPLELFTGDTCIVFAWSKTAPDGMRIGIDIRSDDGRSWHMDLPVSPWPAGDTQPQLLAKLAAASRIRLTDDREEALGLALRYGLISPHTHLLLTAPLDEAQKNKRMPAVRKVPQALAAGWGGSGRVAFAAGPRYCLSPPSRVRKLQAISPVVMSAECVYEVAPWKKTLGRNLKLFYRSDLDALLSVLLPRGAGGLSSIGDFEALRALGVPETIVDALAEISARHGVAPVDAITAFLAVFADSAEAGLVNEQVRKFAGQRLFQAGVSGEVLTAVRQLLIESDGGDHDHNWPTSRGNERRRARLAKRLAP